MNNRDWLSGSSSTGDPYPRPDFVVLSPRETYSRETVVHYFGEPTEEISLNHTVGGYSVLIYSSNSNHKLSQQLLKPTLHWSEGFYGSERSEADEWRWCPSSGVLKINNITNHSIPIHLEFECVLASPHPATFEIESSFYSTRFSIEKQRKHFSQVVRVPTGEHAVCFSTDASPLAAPNDARNLVFQIRNFQANVDFASQP
jgi:hypothetical protein